MFGEDRDDENERWNLVRRIHLFKYVLQLTIHPDSLLSFGKFLELLIYSHTFHVITPPLCEHSGPAMGGKPDAAPSRPGLNIARHFAYLTHRITFTLAVVEEIYNVEVPRVQFTRGAHVSEEAKRTLDTPTVSSQSTVPVEPEPVDVRRMLKREMRTWWHTLSVRIDNLASSPYSHDLPNARLTESFFYLRNKYSKPIQSQQYL